MYQFFVEPGQIQGKRVTITGSDVNHIKNVLRMRIGEEIAVSNGMDGLEYRCGIEEFLEDEVVCTLRFVKEDGLELPSRIYLFQALPKGDKMELVIQKAVELGVNSITPVMTRRCVSRPDAKSMKKKLERYNRIALEAAKQSGRGIIPQVNPLLELDQALRQMQQSGCPILFYENATAPARQLLQSATGKIAILIGAEGGFDEDEVERAKVAGCSILSLGKRILRCETAPLAALSIIMYETGNKE